MATLKKPDDNLAYNSNEHVVWRARAPNGALLLEYVPQGTEGQTVVVEACRFKHLGASSTVMPDFDPSARFGGGPDADAADAATAPEYREGRPVVVLVRGLDIT